MGRDRSARSELRAGATAHRIAIGGDQFAVGSQMKAAVASVKRAARSRDREEALPVEGHVERVAGVGQQRLAKDRSKAVSITGMVEGESVPCASAPT